MGIVFMTSKLGALEIVNEIEALWIIRFEKQWVAISIWGDGLGPESYSFFLAGLEP